MKLHAARRAFISALIVACLLAGSFLSFQCITQPLEPVAPSWDVQLSVPLLDTVRTVDELVQKDTSIIQRDPFTNLIHYKFSTPAASDSIGDRIAMSPRGARVGVRLDTISVDSFQMGQSVAPPGFPPGTYPVPAQTIRIGAIQATAPGFYSLSLSSGTARLVITNNLPIPISFPEPISITDSTGQVVASFSGIVGQIPPGGVDSSSDNLAGRTTNNVIRISTTAPRDSITVSTPGSGTPVTFSPSSNVSFSLVFRNLYVNSATLAVIPAQTLIRHDSTTFVIDDSTFLQSLSFKSGNFTIKIINQVDLDVTVRLGLPQLLKPNNQPYDSTATIFRRDSISVPFDMRQYRVFSPTPTRFLLYTVQLTQLGSSGGQPRTVSPHDSVVATAVVAPGTQFIVRSGSGIIKPTPVNINQRLRLNLGELPSRFSVDTIRLPDASFTLNLKTPIPARVSGFRIVVRKGSGQTDTIRYRDNRNIDLLPIVTNRVLLADSNSTIVDVLNRFVGANSLPDSFRIVGNGLLNYNYDTTVAYFVADTSKIAGDFDVDFPMNIGIKNGTVRDTVDIADKFSVKQEDIDKLNRASITVQVHNALPASLSILFVTMDANRNDTWSFPRSGPIVVNAANVGSNGFSSGSVSSTVPLTIDRQDVRALVNAKFLRVDIRLNTSTSAPAVKFRTSDTIKTRLWGTLSYRVSFGK